MSIYATLWKLKFPADPFDPVNGDWVEVTAQAVPAHVGTPTPGFGYEDGDPFVDFLPPAIEVDADGDAPIYRAVVFVTPQTKKGTSRSGQEYEDPLLCLDGETYAQLSIEALYGKVLQLISPPKTDTLWIL
jgi:hypothetical protein